ncbi:MAG: hypothetical protein FJ095_10810 [Deltaproteobacteria bacterium]|nr:hypothetical protein [Deltaproteobacteria bacterium]
MKVHRRGEAASRVPRGGPLVRPLQPDGGKNSLRVFTRANHGVLSRLQLHHAAISRLIRDIHERIDEGDDDYGRL